MSWVSLSAWQRSYCYDWPSKKYILFYFTANCACKLSSQLCNLFGIIKKVLLRWRGLWWNHWRDMRITAPPAACPALFVSNYLPGDWSSFFLTDELSKRSRTRQPSRSFLWCTLKIVQLCRGTGETWTFEATLRSTNVFAHVGPIISWLMWFSGYFYLIWLFLFSPSEFNLQHKVGVVLCLEVCIILIVHPQSLKRQQNVAVAPLGLSRRTKAVQIKPTEDVYELEEEEKGGMSTWGGSVFTLQLQSHF